MNAWALRHRAALDAVLEPGESLRAAERVRLVGRRRAAGTALPRTGFVLLVTDQRLVVLAASAWLARPGHVINSWCHTEGAKLSVAPLRRLRLLLPDRSFVTLRPFGARSITHLAD